jgi:hypothetical protein
MTDPELDQLLRSTNVPERPPAYWQEFPVRIATRLRQLDVTRPAPGQRRALGSLLWGVGLAAACLLTAFVLVQRGAQSDPAGLPFDAGRRLVREVAALFPDQLQALLIDSNGVQVILSDRPNLVAEQPVIVSFCQDGRRRLVLTSSGHRVQAGRQTFDVLTDGQNNVLLIGDHSFWSSRDGARRIDGYKVEACLLEGVQ